MDIYVGTVVLDDGRGKIIKASENARHADMIREWFYVHAHEIKGPFGCVVFGRNHRGDAVTVHINPDRFKVTNVVSCNNEKVQRIMVEGETSPLYINSETSAVIDNHMVSDVSIDENKPPWNGYVCKGHAVIKDMSLRQSYSKPKHTDDPDMMTVEIGVATGQNYIL